MCLTRNIFHAMACQQNGLRSLEKCTTITVAFLLITIHVLRDYNLCVLKVYGIFH
jgi:hypothetical protein